jgi:hypothetical protein
MKKAMMILVHVAATTPGAARYFVRLITTMNPSRGTKTSPRFLFCVRTLRICESSRCKESQIYTDRRTDIVKDKKKVALEGEL